LGHTRKLDIETVRLHVIKKQRTRTFESLNSLQGDFSIVLVFKTKQFISSSDELVSPTIQ